MTIKALDDNLINKIAAGEVIERPASVVKELVENAIDAGATTIKVSISQGGIASIDIEDNGEGMKREEIPLAFQRHATSKIEVAEELFNITSMGFRGEALPSIASVSRIKLFSKKNGSTGVLAYLEGGNFLKLENYPSPEGTRIVVRDLFYNTPVRRNFLKSPVSEGEHIYEIVCKYALARPDISFIFSNEKRKFFKTPGNGNLKDVVLSLYGRDFASYLIEVDYMGEEYSVKGLISSPELRRFNRKNQIFFVNRRPVRSVVLYKVLDQVYQGRLLSREYPAAILSINVPPPSVDVNVHPQKAEVRFQDEKAVFRVVYSVLKDCLDQVDYNPLKNQQFYNKSNLDNISPVLSNRELYETAINYDFSGLDLVQANNTTTKDSLAARDLSVIPVEKVNKGTCPFKIIGQCLNSYILLESAQSLYLVDQHAAHERIMYNRIKESYSRGKENAQVLAVPLPIDLSPRQIAIIEKKNDLLAELGFTLDVISPNTVLLRTAPVSMAGQELDIINELLELWQDNSLPDLREESFKTIACKKAVKAGDGLFLPEMERIITDLFETENYKNCPHGRPTIIKISHSELNRLFKR
ncbi:MAG: DNA mismatch repair endonuclease MutL [Syntrophomonadaceae bacterium]|jgi:DNA mismatch repair protein MutL